MRLSRGGGGALTQSFYDSAITFFPKHGVRQLDAVVLTHEHADAILGMAHASSLPTLPRRLTRSASRARTMASQGWTTSACSR